MTVLQHQNLSRELAKNVPIGEIDVNPYQPRRHFSAEEIRELAESIDAVGLIHPPLVRTKRDGGYELIAGERRLRACQSLGYDTICVVITNSSAFESAQAALVENIQRSDLNPIEIALSLQSLVDDYGLKQDELAGRIGKKRSTVANYLRILSLPESIKNSIDRKEISMGHAKVILSVEREDRKMLLHDLILRETLTVRQTEERVEKWNKKHKPVEPVMRTRNFHVEHLEQKIQQHLGTKVRINTRGKKGNKGSITIDYHSFDDLDGLIKQLGVETN